MRFFRGELHGDPEISGYQRSKNRGTAIAATGAGATLNNVLDPRLGWLEAFVATAQHLSYEDAGGELGISPISVKRNVERLELWLHKVLILDENPLSLSPIDGEEFLAVSIKVLEKVRGITKPNDNCNSVISLRKSRASTIRLSAFRTLLCLADKQNYKSVAFELNRSEEHVRRNVKDLEKKFGSKIFIGHSEQRLTEFGREILIPIASIVESMSSSVADIPDNYNAVEGELKLIWRVCSKRKIELTMIIQRAKQKPSFTKLDSLKVDAAMEQLALCDGVLETISKSGLISVGPVPIAP